MTCVNTRWIRTYYVSLIYIKALHVHQKNYEFISSIIVVLVSSKFQFLVDGPGMSFAEGIICPQASQTCCDNSGSSMLHIQSAVVFQLHLIYWQTLLPDRQFEFSIRSSFVGSKVTIITLKE